MVLNKCVYLALTFATAAATVVLRKGVGGQLNYSNHASLMCFKIAVYLQSGTCKLNFIMFTSQ